MTIISSHSCSLQHYSQQHFTKSHLRWYRNILETHFEKHYLRLYPKLDCSKFISFFKYVYALAKYKFLKMQIFMASPIETFHTKKVFSITAFTFPFFRSNNDCKHAKQKQKRKSCNGSLIDLNALIFWILINYYLDTKKFHSIQKPRYCRH